MSHEIFQEKFFSHRQPAWHGLGTVMQDEKTALEAGEILQIPHITTHSLTLDFNPPHMVDTLDCPDHKAIVSHVTETTGIKRYVLAVVSQDYQVPTHSAFIEAWESATGSAPVETMGLLGKGGHTLFISSKLPTFSVLGDEVDNYLMAFNPLNGSTALTGRETPVRVVCANTLRMSEQNCRSEFRAIHVGAGATLQQIHRWLRDLWDARQLEADFIKMNFETMARKAVNDALAKDTIDAVYSFEDIPKALPSPLVTAESGQVVPRQDVLSDYNQKQKTHRENVYALFAGHGTGMAHPATDGTAWGLYNAFTEYENFGRKYAKQASRFVGAGARRMETALDQCLALTK